MEVNGKRVREKARENLAELLETLVKEVSSYGKDISNYTLIQFINALRNKPHYDYALSKVSRITNIRIYRRHNEVAKKQEPIELDF